MQLRKMAKIDKCCPLDSTFIMSVKCCLLAGKDFSIHRLSFLYGING